MRRDLRHVSMRVFYRRCSVSFTVETGIIGKYWFCVRLCPHTFIIRMRNGIYYSSVTHQLLLNMQDPLHRVLVLRTWRQPFIVSMLLIVTRNKTQSVRPQCTGLFDVWLKVVRLKKWKRVGIMAQHYEAEDVWGRSRIWWNTEGKFCWKMC